MSYLASVCKLLFSVTFLSQTFIKSSTMCELKDKPIAPGPYVLPSLT